VGEGSGAEQLDLHQTVEIRSVLIKSRPPDLGRTPEIQQPVTGHGCSGAARPSARSRRRRGDGHGGALGAWGRVQARSGRHGELDRGHHTGAEAPESAEHGEAG
jgi:hypothetical protein